MTRTSVTPARLELDADTHPPIRRAAMLRPADELQRGLRELGVPGGNSRDIKYTTMKPSPAAI